MEEIYNLSDGTTVDISKYSQLERTKFFMENPGAAKRKGTAMGEVVVPGKKRSPNTDSSSENTSLDSKKKLRLPTEAEFEELQKKSYKKPTYGVEPPNPTLYEDFYNLKAQTAEPIESEELKNSLPKSRSVNIGKFIPKEEWSTWDLIVDEPSTENVKSKDKKLRLPTDEDLEVYKTKDNKNRIEAYIKQKKLDKPNIYDTYDEGDDFASSLYDTKDLSSRNINISDLNGFLTAKGYKQDMKRFMELELDKESYSQGYDAQLAFEKRKIQYLNAYIDEQIKRDIKRQKLDYEYKTQENPDFTNKKFKPGKFSANFDLTAYESFIKKEAPMLSQKMIEIDQKNLEKYNKLVKSKGNVGAGEFLGSVLENGWNGLSDAINSFSASAYGVLPGDYFEGISESIREDLSFQKMDRGDNYRYVTANGEKVEVDGIEYIADTFEGTVYDVTNKINVTNVLLPKQKESILKKAREEGVRSWSFSKLGSSYQAANVIGDLIFQLALTRGSGTSIKAVGGFAEGLGVLGKTKDFLRSVPLKRSIVDATIAQSTLGFSKGYEDTLRAAREAGISDNKATELASLASMEMGVWYAATAWINPQTRTSDMIFGKAKNEVLEKAISSYLQNGKKGFLNTIRGYAKGFVDITGEGIAEVFQENIQQAGEVFVINKDVNELAGQNLLKDTMSLQDFMDTTILSFVAGSLIPGAGAAVNASNKTVRQLLGMQGVDRFNALNTLARNRDKVDDLLSTQIEKGVYTKEEVERVLEEIDAYNSTINKMPGDISANAAENILGDIKEIADLEQKKKTTDKSFHSAIDEELDVVRSRVERAYYDDVTSKRTSAIKKLIKEGKVGDIEYREFNETQDVVKVLTEEFNYDDENAKAMASNPGFILTEDILKRKLDKDKFVPGKKVLFINNGMAAEDSQFSVGKHEFLHGVIYETIKGDKEAQVLLGRALTNEILSLEQKIKEGEKNGLAIPPGFLRRFKEYVDKYSPLIRKQDYLLKAGLITQAERDNQVNTYLGNQWEEVLTLYSDAIDNGTVVFDDDIFTRLGDIIRQVLQRLGIKNIQFNSGKDVYNFIKDYNRSIEKGTFGGILGRESALEKVAKKGAKVNKESLKKIVGDSGIKPQQKTTKDKDGFSTDAKFSLKQDRIDPDKFKKDINSFYDKNKWGSEKGYIDRVLYDILNKYEVTIVQKAKGYGYAYLPDYSEMDMVSETQVALLPVIRNFNKEFFELREGYKKELEKRGFKEGSDSFNKELEEQDSKGYKGKKGIVKENTDLNAYINSLLKFKMMDALKTGYVTSQQYTEDIDSEFFKESKSEGFDYQDSEEMLDDIDSLLDEQQSFEQEQSKLAVLLRDPIFGFIDEDGNPIEIETIPFGAQYVQDIDDDIIPANKRLKKTSDPGEIKEIKKQLEKLKRGLELEAKEKLTEEEKQELKSLKSFKSYNLSTGGMVNTYEALSTLDKPAKIISSEIAREIQRSPNLETLEYRNFKDKLSITSQTMARRMTFKNSDNLNKFMYDNWELIYNVINNPVDPVSGESSYASKKLPPRLKELDSEGNFKKKGDINRTTFLQSYFGNEDTIKIITKYSKNPEVEIKKLDDAEVNEKTGNKLWATAYFDRRTALMELFGDVLVLQEARRLIRDDAFLETIKERNENLYNDLKDDIKRDAVLNDMAKGKSDVVKFSLAEKNNAKLSPYMDNFNIGEQFFIARIIDKAINNVKKATTKKNTFKVPILRGMNDKTKSFYLIDKVAKGYNDFQFLNEEDAKGKLTNQVLENSDVKYSLYEDNAGYNSDLETTMNEIIQDNKGIEVNERFSPETAKNIGKNIGKYDLWLPPEDEDFIGLIYTLANAKGKMGEAQMDFFQKNLVKPYSEAMLNLMRARQVMYKDWKDLINKKYKGITKKLKEDSGYGNYTIDQAVRVYLWSEAKYEIPGLDAKDLFNLKNIVRTNKELREFAKDVSYLSKQANGYVKPDHNWGLGSIVGDINNVISKSNRTKFLEHWQSNVDKIFSKDNLSKIEAVYGTAYALSLKNSLKRMQLGTNRLDNSSDAFLNWLNGATGVTMWFNMRSAVLQTISASNFINMTDNNIVKAGVKMVNFPQFRQDFLTLWNSDYLKDRRSGLMNDVADAELAQMMNDQRNKNVLDLFKSFNYWLLKTGYLPTRFADSFAIAFGGASFYRNRIETYKKQGLTEDEAAKKTMADFYQTAEESQQSADTSKISKNQASTKGRLLFAFQNTPLQYGRIIKKSTIDLIKGRGDFKTNIAKILYYGALQNIIFNFMQNALFSILWDDEDEGEEEGLDKNKTRALNGWLDTLLKGSGLKGAVISTIKNVAIKWYDVHGDPKAGAQVAIEALNIAPSIGIKARKLEKSYKTLEYNWKEVEYEGFSINNKYAIEAAASLTSATINVPTDRLYQKVVNVQGALNSDYEWYERLAMTLGYNQWNLGIEENEKGTSNSGQVIKRKGLKQKTIKKRKLVRK